jgi:hypothetical protein
MNPMERSRSGLEVPQGDYLGLDLLDSAAPIIGDIRDQPTVGEKFLKVAVSCALIDHTNRSDRALLRQFLVRSKYILCLSLEMAESWEPQELSFSDFLDDLVEGFDFESEVDLRFDCRLPTGHSERDQGQLQSERRMSRSPKSPGSRSSCFSPIE